MEKKTAQRIILLGAVLFLCLIAGLFWWKQRVLDVVFPHHDKVFIDPNESHHICVFVHGTFGATFGFFDLPAILQDKLKGSYYSRVVRNMRKDPFFYRGQILLQRGFHYIVPTFKNEDEKNFFAAYSITKAHQECMNYISTLRNEKEERHYYLFGWSGLLSQTKRRVESVRLYNALCQEVQRFIDKGVTPKVTIFAHSHGGNVALNLGGIWSFVQGDASWAVSDEPFDKAIKLMKEYCEKLPTQEEAKEGIKQKVFDYAPQKLQVPISRLVLLGTPIQPETDQYALSPLFKEVLNVYSLADPVQVSDWLSTSRYYSDQVFFRIKELWAKEGRKFPDHLLQVKVTIGQELSSDGKKLLPLLGQNQEKVWSFWNFFVGNIVSIVPTHDPTHKELWFLVAPSGGVDGDDFKPPLKPFPLVSYSPMVLDLIARNREKLSGDFQINVRRTEVAVVFDLVQTESLEIVDSLEFPVEYIEEMKKQVSLELIPVSEEGELISNHMKSAKGISGVKEALAVNVG